MDALIDISTNPRAYQNYMDPYERIGEKKAEVEEFVKGLRVFYEIPNEPSSKRTYKVIELSYINNFVTFENPITGRQEKNTIGVYYKLMKNYQLEHPIWPCVRVEPKEKNLILPVEVSVHLYKKMVFFS